MDPRQEKERALVNSWEENGAVVATVCQFLTVKDLGRLEATSRTMLETVRTFHVWDSMALTPKAHPAAILDLESQGKIMLEIARNARAQLFYTALRWEVELQLFLPELYGYSLVQPSVHDCEKSLRLVSSQAVESLAVDKLNWCLGPGWVTLVSEPPSGIITFMSPYKVYWIHAKMKCSRAGNSKVGKIVDGGKFLSLNSEVVCEAEPDPLKDHGLFADETSEIQRQLMGMEGFQDCGASASASSNSGQFKWTWVSASPESAPHNDPVEEIPLDPIRVYYFVRSSSKSSKVRIDRVCVAVRHPQWCRLVEDLNGIGSAAPILG